MRVLLGFFLFWFSLLGATPKVVVFDFGGVVANVDRKPMIEFLAESLDIPYKKVKKDFSSDLLYNALQKDVAFWSNYARKDLSKEWEKQLEEKKRQLVQEIPGVRNLIGQIKEQGIQVALLSNTQAARARFIEGLGGYDLFDPILLSCHLGVSKPNPKIFEKLITCLPYAPQDCLLIDNRKKNVKAGKKQGIDGIVFTSADQLAEALKTRGISINRRGDKACESLETAPAP